jgi:hypothetical protein
LKVVAVAEFAGHPDPAAVVGHDAVRDRQTQPGAAGGALPGRVGAPEPVEDPGQVGGRDTHAGVAYGKHRRAALLPQLDQDVAARVRVADRVGQQVAHDLAQPVRVGLEPCRAWR